MPGIRLQLSAEALATINQPRAPAGLMWIVRDQTRAIKGPPYPECHMCGHHEVKTYHLNFDQEGTVMVSTTIWHQLQLLHDNGGLEKVNVVEKPPAQNIELPTAHVKMTVTDL